MRNEADRYLQPWLEHLLDFCDEVCVYDDGSRDGTSEILAAYEGVEVMTGVLDISSFDAHEGKARQRLLEFTMESEPTHVLAIDADEFVSDGQWLRDELFSTAHRTHSRPGAWNMRMEEIWEIDGDCLCVREDRLWGAHLQPLVWAAPVAALGSNWRIQDRALASGRIPLAALQKRARSLPDLSVLHFGWTNPATRQARYDRYMRIDGGRFHQNDHLASIMLPEDQILLEGRPWPDGLAGVRAEITRRASS